MRNLDKSKNVRDCPFISIDVSHSIYKVICMYEFYIYTYIIQVSRVIFIKGQGSDYFKDPENSIFECAIDN